MPSLSQTHRPRRFAQVTGQEHVTETLRREIVSGLLAHAYVFCGPRGVGKTTTARIFAQALNCVKPEEGEPCGSCSPCEAFAAGRLLDLIELDAATHTGVDTIREAIVEHVRFAPAFGKAKVYILDEAHMLSTSSWNALLKTLEEPPPYAYFILATTEWHKIPATILSRCQRFEFTRVADDVLTKRVHELAQREGWRIDKEVVRLIISRADGCVRDAETLLGQLGALGETHINAALAAIVIPPTHLPLAASLMQTWVDHDHGVALQTARTLLDNGINPTPLFDDLLTITRRLLCAEALPETAKEWSKGTVEERSMAPLVHHFSPLELHDIALMLMERRKDVKAGIDALFALELASTLVIFGIAKTKSIEYRVSSIENREPTPDTRYPIPDTLRHPAEAISEALSLATVRSKWQAIIRAIDEKNHSLPFILKISQPHEVQGNTLIIRFQYPFHRDKVVTDVKHRHVVEACAREILGVPRLVIEGIVGEEIVHTSAREQDMVTNILKAFGGQVVEEQR